MPDDSPSRDRSSASRENDELPSDASRDFGEAQDSNADGEFGAGPRPSSRLARRAVAGQHSVLHIWNHGAGGDLATMGYTANEQVDWAFCVPILSDACPGWALYVTGQLRGDALTPTGNLSPSEKETSPPKILEDDVKFTELVAQTIANVRQTSMLQRRAAGLRRFFAPVVMDALATRNAEQVLAPREADLSVMFCDLRGFSRQSERDKSELMQLLARVSNALGIMTGEILQRDGVVGDFHGDAAMGFWGWPLHQQDAIGRATRAALAIATAFKENRDSDMSGFRCGIGIASGRAVAGRIGTEDQVKVTAFGPVVNLASRLEGMTKTLGATILIDSASAQYVRDHVPRDVARVRRLANVRPAGMRETVVVSQLLPGPDSDEESLADIDLQRFETAVQSFIDGAWEDAYELLHQIPASDRAKDYLIAMILRHARVAPDSWDGVLKLEK
ncbi:MAG: adenylate/guanylate cyclase domain-containing protein, partial [Planctomycetota bacterium]